MNSSVRDIMDSASTAEELIANLNAYLETAKSQIKSEE